VKKSQIELMHVLKNADKWLTAFELAERVDISPIQVRRLIATAAFKDVAKGIFDTERPHGGRYVAVYRLIPKQKGKADQALELAKRHQGVWGQLMWINQPKVELVERT
jgi:predicted transcriptional regulator